MEKTPRSGGVSEKAAELLPASWHQGGRGAPEPQRGGREKQVTEKELPRWSPYVYPKGARHPLPKPSECISSSRG